MEGPGGIQGGDVHRHIVVPFWDDGLEMLMPELLQNFAQNPPISTFSNS